jgi:hypothetical protein
MEMSRGHRRLEDRHAESDRNRRDEEEERQKRRVPERVQLAGNDQVEAAEGRLVNDRHDDADDDDGRRNGAEDAQRLVEAQPFEDDRRKLESQDAGIEHHAPADEEHDRPRVPHDQRMPDAVRASEVEQDSSFC